MINKISVRVNSAKMFLGMHPMTWHEMTPKVRTFECRQRGLNPAPVENQCPPGEEFLQVISQASHAMEVGKNQLVVGIDDGA